jgi:predicted transposase YbfD/YdcC
MANILYISNSETMEPISDYINSFKKTSNKFSIDVFISSIEEVETWFNENDLQNACMFQCLSRLILDNIYHFQKTPLFNEIFKFLKALYKSNNLAAYLISGNQSGINVILVAKKTFEYLSDISKENNYFLTKNYNIEKLNNYIDTFRKTENKFSFDDFVKNYNEIVKIYDKCEVEDLEKMMILTTHISKNLNNFQRTKLFDEFYDFLEQFCFENDLISSDYSSLEEFEFFIEKTFDNLEFIGKKIWQTN